jgi:hypothetical protein
MAWAFFATQGKKLLAGVGSRRGRQGKGMDVMESAYHLQCAGSGGILPGKSNIECHLD